MFGWVPPRCWMKFPSMWSKFPWITYNRKRMFSFIFMRLTWIVVLYTSLWLVEGDYKPQRACVGWASVTEPCLEVCMWIKCTRLDKVPPRHPICFFPYCCTNPNNNMIFSIMKVTLQKKVRLLKAEEEQFIVYFHVMHRWYKLTLMMLTVLTAHLCITGMMSCHSTYCSWFRLSSMRLTLTVPLSSSSWRVPSKISIWDTNSSGFWGTNLLVISNGYFKKKCISFFKGIILLNLKELPFLLTLSNCVGSGLPTDVCNFTWQHEKCKGHKSGSKYKLVHFPLWSLPWINDATIWAILRHFFHHMCDWCTFFKTKYQHPGEGAIWISLARREYKITWLSV